MQKSKIFTIIIIVIMLLFGLIGTCKLVFEINDLYTYFLNPLFWIGLAVFLGVNIPKGYASKRLKKEIISYILIASFSFIIIYMISGLFVTFGKNPYSTTIKGFFINLWIFYSIMVAKEYIRYLLINNVYDKDKIFISILISSVYVVLDTGLNRFINSEAITNLMLIKLLTQVILPSIARNVLFSYIAMYSDYVPAIIYEFITNAYMWISPIVPNSPWIITVVIEAIIPIIVYSYIRYTKIRSDLFKSRQKLLKADPRGIIPIVVFVVLASWFALGIFPISPVAIATGSMEPELYVGDIAIMKKASPNDIEIGDIIQYKMEGYSVVHRVIQKDQKGGTVTFITKGDNNNSPDFYPVKEDQLMGKVIYKIKYIGLPTIWLHIVQRQEVQNLSVETGK